ASACRPIQAKYKPPTTCKPRHSQPPSAGNDAMTNSTSSMLSRLARAMPQAQPSAWRRPFVSAVRINRKKSGPGDSKAAKWVPATSMNSANMGTSVWRRQCQQLSVWMYWKKLRGAQHMPCHPPLHVLTGGPGSGKSSLLAALAQAGHSVSEEAGRAIIRDQQSIAGLGRPGRDPSLFAE